MAQDSQSEGTQLFEFDPAAVAKPARRSVGLTLLQGVVAMGTFAAVVAMFSAGVVWIVNRTPKPDSSAGAFVWFGGQNKTGGRDRPEEEYYDWTKEAGNNAKSKGR